MTEIVFNGANSGIQIAVNYGEINNPQFYLPPERPETPPEPLSTVPFDRDRDYVNHGALLEQIEIKGSEVGSRIALVGLGGVGKSQLAIEYSYRLRDESPKTWIFWIHANNAARFEQSCRDIADRVKIYGRRNSQANIFKLFHDWLQDERHGKWVIILDNLDDDQFLHEIPPVQQDGQGKDESVEPGRSIWEYFPRSLKGKILITSRSRRVVSSIVEDRDIIPVGLMEQDDAVKLFEKKLGAEGNREDIIDLTKALDFMPLAIVQAASYIKQLAPRLSVPEYLMEFRKSDSQKVTLLGYENGHLRRDPQAQSSILVTWQISFDHIRETRSSAADLLSLMSFFDRQGIPDTLLQEGKTVKLLTGSPASEAIDEATDNSDTESPSESSVVDWTFEHDVLLLRDYSLISIGANNTSFEMHRLVQLAMQKWLEVHDQHERWKERFIRNLYSNFPVSSFENWPRCQLLFPHVQCALTQRPHTETSLGEWASLLHEGASFTLSRGNAVDSSRMAKKAVQARQGLFGPEDEKTLSSSEVLGLAYRNAGEWKKAATLFEQVLKTCRAKFGEDHPSTLTSLANLALSYSDLGRLEESEEIQVQVLETRKKKLGEHHSDTLTSMNNLATTYGCQGRWKDAEMLHLQVLAIRKASLGKDHSLALTSMSNLALTYWKKGQWQQAEELQKKVLGIITTKLGKDHPKTLTSMNNLASTYSYQGRWTEAEELELQVLEARKLKLGVDHPETLISMANLASSYSTQGRWKDAEKLQVHVMKTCKTKFGENHPDTLRSIGNLAETYLSQGRWEEAEQLQTQLAEIRRTTAGEDHPDTLTSIANLALTLSKKGRWQEAEKLLAHLIETSQVKLGENHPDTLTFMANLASIYQSQSRLKEAEALKEKVMARRMTYLGKDHPDTLISMGDLASIYQTQGRWKEAEKIQVPLLEICKSKLGKDHPNTLTTMSNLALSYSEQGLWEDAAILQVQEMEACKYKMGNDHPDTLISMGNLAGIYRKQAKWNEAATLDEQTLEIRRAKLGEDHPDTLTSMNNLALSYQGQDQWEKAETLLRKVAEIRKIKLGKNHASTQRSVSNLALVYWKTGRWKEAEELQMEVTETCKMTLGESNPLTLTAMANLAFFRKSSGNAASAILLLGDAVAKMKQTFGPDHPQTALHSTLLRKWESEQTGIILSLSNRRAPDFLHVTLVIVALHYVKITRSSMHGHQPLELNAILCNSPCLSPKGL